MLRFSNNEEIYAHNIYGLTIFIITRVKLVFFFY